MYFKDKDNTNIDHEFNNKNNNILTYIINLIKKYKIILIILLIIIISIIIISLLTSNKSIIVTNNLILNGDEVLTIYEDSDYIEPGYDAYNSRNEDLTSSVSISSNLDTKNIGEYEITYTLDDIVKTRKVIVVEKPKIYTFIRLNTIDNNVNIYLKLGEEYNEPGYQVFSSTGEDLNNKVLVTGSVDTSKKGNYKLIYSLVDSAGVTVSTSRIVIVMDTEISLSLSTSEYTNKDITINVNVIDEFFNYIIFPDGSKITNKTSSYNVSENGKYTFKTYSTKGVEKEVSINVNNIDKVNPTGSCSGSFENGVSTINVSANDNIGIKKYEVNGTSYTNNKITINKELSNVIVKVYDKAGNTKDISCSLKNNNASSSSSSSKSSSSSSSSKSSSSSSSSKSSSSSSSNKSSSSSSGTIQTTKNISVNLYKNFSYWLYLPDNVTKNLPIIVYLPGLGERGNDYYGSKTAIQYGPINEIKDYGYSYNAIVVHMQVPSNDSVYGYLDDYVTLINQIANKYNANKNKISIIGFSHGCYGLLNMLPKYPNYFSAAVFVGCGPNKQTDLSKFIYQPIWTFVGGGDGESDYSDQYGSHYSFENFVKNINAIGGNAKSTSVKQKSSVHNIMNDSYSILRDSDYNVINWMISQTKK